MLKLYITLLALLVTVAPQAAYIAGDVFIATDTSGTNAVPTNTFNITSTNASLTGTLRANSGVFTNSLTVNGNPVSTFTGTAGTVVNTGTPAVGQMPAYSDTTGTNIVSIPLFAGTTNTIEQRNGTSAQTFNVYNTYTDASNYERVGLFWNANTAFLRTANAGTGTSRNLALDANGGQLSFQVAGSTIARVTAAGLIFPTDNSFDIGASGATRPRNLFVAGNATIGGQGTFSTLIVNSGTTTMNQLSIAAGNSYLWSGRGGWSATGDGAFRALSSASANAGITAGTLTLTPASANTTALTISGGSNTGSDTTAGESFAWTWNTSGNATAKLNNVVNTASGASSKVEDWQVDGTSQFAITKATGVTVGTAGLRDYGSGQLGLGGASANSLYLASTSIQAVNRAFSFGTTIAAPDTFIVREAAATLQLGNDAASPVAQKLKAHDGSGTDIAGGALTIAGGQSTGTGRGGAVIIQTSPSGSTGSSANTYSERAHYAAKAVTLTEATATTVATIAVPAAKYVGAQFVVTVFATDGTDHQARTLRFGVSAINKAGTVTAAIDTPDESIAVSAGTLTATITAVANGNAVDVKVDSTSSLTQTTLSAKVAITGINSNDTAAVTEI